MLVQVKVSDGTLEGEVVHSNIGGKFYSFKGIPYAQPPLGDLRFKAPQPVSPWTGVRSAKAFGPMCFQFNKLSKEPAKGSEDCLYLNVYSPEIKPSAPLPVMVFIHGGGLLWGSGNDDMYGPEFLVKHGVILVTFNYRLETLGFLCLHTKDIPGNAGMKDQVAAMRWVKKNISNFGGDSENITIFGESAGAGCVSLHLISPMTKGLFKRAICQSGSASCWWATIQDPRERALILARRLGCYSDDDDKLYQIFKHAPPKALVNVNIEKKGYATTFAIVDEKQFDDNERYFFGDVFNGLRNEIHEGVDIIVGYNEHDGNIALSVALNGPLNETIVKANQNLDFFIPRPLSYNTTVEEQEDIAKSMKKYFLRNQPASKSNLNQLIKFFNMEIFTHGIITFGKFVSNKKSNKVYIYKFNCKTDRNLFGLLYEINDFFKTNELTSHGDDLFYLFPTKILPQKLSHVTFKVVDTFTKLWTNFAKYGNPTPNTSMGVTWHPFTEDKQEYLEIGNKLVLKTKPDEEDVKFWESIYEKYLPGYGWK